MSAESANQYHPYRRASYSMCDIEHVRTRRGLTGLWFGVGHERVAVWSTKAARRLPCYEEVALTSEQVPQQV